MAVVIDWQVLEERLFEQSCAVIKQFAEDHPDVICSFFAYDTDPGYGYFLLSFDTAENSLQQALKNEYWAIEERKKMLSQEWSWNSARSLSRVPPITDYSPDVGYFAYYMYAEIRFPELVEFKESEAYPQRSNEVEDDYLEGHVRVVLWKIIERLIASAIFSQLRLSSLFRVGYQFHEEDLLVLRILNWPAAQVK